MVTLGEGDTPLIKTKRLSHLLNLGNLHIKNESVNPTWSHKDRLCCSAVSKGKEFNAKTITVSSTGNHGASTSAYAAVANMECVVFTLPSVPQSMLTLIQMYGAKAIPVTTSEGRWDLMQICVEKYGWQPTGTYTLPPTGNPYGVQGYKTIAFELIEDLKWVVPDAVIVPVGYGELLYGIWRGFFELRTMGLIDRLPKMIGVEPSSGGPLHNALERGLEFPEKIASKHTIAFSIGTTNTSYQGLVAIKDSKGLVTLVSDKEILNAQASLAKKEGLYVEPASAASIAGTKKLVEQGEIGRNDLVVAVVTSSGLKDIGASKSLILDLPPLEPIWDKFRKYMQDHYQSALE